MSQKITPYIRSPLPSLPGSERIWLESELQKLEETNRDLIAYIKFLEARIVALGG